MMKLLFKAAIGVVLLLVLGVGALLIPAVQTYLVVLNLPEFPDWPSPKTTLVSEDEGEIYYATESPFDLEVILSGNGGRATTGLGYLTFPEDTVDTEPLPAMVVLPGSGGIKPGREHEYAEFLNGEGIAAFVVEYYASRGLSDETNYLLRTGSVTEFDLITDAYAALALLSTHPRIDGNRVGVVGFSYGGMAARLLMDDRIHQAIAPAHPGFAAHIDIYGPCFQYLGTKKTNGAPLLTLRGTNDASNDLEACATRESELRDLGVQVTAVLYEGAGHAWENSQQQFLSESSPYLHGCEWRYDEVGVPWVDGELLLSYSPNASRAARIAARLRMGSQLGDCVKKGYLIGRDEKTRNQAYLDAAKFLHMHL
ncbi:dienelactone hydrolase family protein [Pseudomonadales bacterium]|jgi:dienelactone hydrolase|nr:dienelactone hydrolase family protein [Pseudomonadales bacterium]